MSAAFQRKIIAISFVIIALSLVPQGLAFVGAWYAELATYFEAKKVAKQTKEQEALCHRFTLPGYDLEASQHIYDISNQWRQEHPVSMSKYHEDMRKTSLQAQEKGCTGFRGYGLVYPPPSEHNQQPKDAYSLDDRDLEDLQRN